METIFSTQIWTIGISVIGVLYAIFLSTLDNDTITEGRKPSIFPFIFVIFVTIYIGTRPLWCYADTWLYTTMFQLVQDGIWENFKDADREIFWTNTAWFCVKHANASTWLLIISIFYIGGMAYAAYKWLPRHFLIALIFLFTAFSFWGYATNGIRHGMATSIAMVALTCFGGSKKKIAIGYALFLLSVMTHTSCALIMAVATLSLFLKNISTSIKIWILCIIVGFFAQEPLKQLISFIVNDERMTNYLLLMDDSNLFSHTGFRWDFVIYSSIPIIFGWHAIVKNGVRDKVYIFLVNTYIYSNAFWVLINTANYSNRFAYLSWFLYPILLAYPLCRFKIYQEQGITLCLTMLISIAFTFIMQL